MADLQQLKQKYQPVLDVLAKEDATIQAVDLQGDKLHIKAVVVSEASKNHIWDAIKSVDPSFADLQHEITLRRASRRTPSSQATISPRSAGCFTAIPINIRKLFGPITCLIRIRSKSGNNFEFRRRKHPGGA